MLNAALTTVAVSANADFVIINPLDSSAMAADSMWRERGLASFIERRRRLGSRAGAESNTPKRSHSLIFL
jgi:hypothetical protein